MKWAPIVFVGGSCAAQAQPLERGDDARSYFAGNDLERVQAARSGGRARSQESSPAPNTDPQNRQHIFQKDSSAETCMSALQSKDYPVQSVFLNGENVVGLRDQTLKGVTVHFDARGNVLIDAPHYHVTYDTTYHPLLPGETPTWQKQPAELPDLPLGN